MASNATLTTGTLYEIDASTELILIVNPNANVRNGNFNFTFVMSGTQYSWWEKLIAGPNGTTYFWVGIGCGGAIVLILIIIIIWLIVRCCRRRAQVQDEGGNNYNSNGYNSGKNQ